MENVSENRQREIMKKHMLLNLAELLEKEGLLTVSERDRMMSLIVSHI